MATPPEPLFTVRSALVLLLALVVGLVAGGLAFAAEHSLATAALVGGGAAGGGVRPVSAVTLSTCRCGTEAWTW